MRIVSTEREITTVEADEVLEAVELVQDDIAAHGIKATAYVVGYITVEIES